MRVVLQRVSSASVKVEEKVISKIENGFLILLGITHDDTLEDINWLVKKITQLRVFSDANQNMNLSIQDIQGSFLVVSQFTLHASTKKGNRPSFINAARPEMAIPLYEYFLKHLEEQSNCIVCAGKFGAQMEVSLINNGPVTIIIDSKNKE